MDATGAFPVLRVDLCGGSESSGSIAAGSRLGGDPKRLGDASGAWGAWWEVAVPRDSIRERALVKEIVRDVRMEFSGEDQVAAVPVDALRAPAVPVSEPVAAASGNVKPQAIAAHRSGDVGTSGRLHEPHLKANSQGGAPSAEVSGAVLVAAQTPACDEVANNGIDGAKGAATEAEVGWEDVHRLRALLGEGCSVEADWSQIPREDTSDRAPGTPGVRVAEEQGAVPEAEAPGKQKRRKHHKDRKGRRHRDRDCRSPSAEDVRTVRTDEVLVTVESHHVESRGVAGGRDTSLRQLSAHVGSQRAPERQLVLTEEDNALEKDMARRARSTRLDKEREDLAKVYTNYLIVRSVI